MCESNAFLMKKYQGKLQSDVFPAVVVMLTQVENEDDLETWAETPEEDVLASNDPSSVAAEAISRMAEDLGEKVTIASTTQVITECVGNTASWKHRAAGYTTLAMIAEPCSKTFRKNVNDTLSLVAKGLLDEHPRVRYASLTAMGLLMNTCAPNL
jgi:hypothetical protein